MYILSRGDFKVLSADFADCEKISVINVTHTPSEKADKMPKQVEFSRWLQDQLDARGWTQSDLANKAGINRQVVYGWLGGKKPTAENLVLVAKAFEISPMEILRVAGVLPTEKGDRDAITETIVHLIGDLDTATKLRILEQIKLERRLSGKGENHS